MITLTTNAKTQLLKLIQQKNEKGYFMRVGVKGGGCSGMSYSVELDNQVGEWDKVFGSMITKP